MAKRGKSNKYLIFGVLLVLIISAVGFVISAATPRVSHTVDEVLGRDGISINSFFLRYNLQFLGVYQRLNDLQSENGELRDMLNRKDKEIKFLVDNTGLTVNYNAVFGPLFTSWGKRMKSDEDRIYAFVQVTTNNKADCFIKKTDGSWREIQQRHNRERTVANGIVYDTDDKWLASIFAVDIFFDGASPPSSGGDNKEYWVFVRCKYEGTNIWVPSDQGKKTSIKWSET